MEMGVALGSLARQLLGGKPPDARSRAAEGQTWALVPVALATTRAAVGVWGAQCGGMDGTGRYKGNVEREKERICTVGYPS